MKNTLKTFFLLTIMLFSTTNAFAIVRPNTIVNPNNLYTKTPEPTLKVWFQQGVFKLFFKVLRPNQTKIEKLVTILAAIASIAIVVWAIILGVIFIRGILSFLGWFL
jgi:hypothetical protein